MPVIGERERGEFPSPIFFTGRKVREGDNFDITRFEQETRRLDCQRVFLRTRGVMVAVDSA